MAQTKRKRRSKHRGNAAGTIETRGRTGKPAPGAEKRPAKGTAARNQRQNRFDRPPTWRGAAVKAGFAALLLLVLTQIGLFGGEVPLANALLLCAFALVLYIPLSYTTDRWVYQRRQKMRGRK